MRVRGVLVGYLSLVALYALVSARGPEHVSGLLKLASDGMARLLDPKVAGLRNFTATAAKGAAPTEPFSGGDFALTSRRPGLNQQVPRLGHPVPS